MSEPRKVALITGANRGLGLETARQLGALGMIVLLGSRDLSRGDEAAGQLRSAGMDARAIKLDMLAPEDYASVAKLIESEFGKLDVLVNNAAINLDQGVNHEASTVPKAILRETFATNFFAVVELTQTLLPLIRKSAAGRIVNVSSGQGSLTDLALPDMLVYGRKTYAYDASKTVLNSFTIHLAHELRDTKVKVNSLHPGWVKTDMGGMNADLELVDGAKTSVMLATLADNGPTGGYFHLNETLPW